MAALRASVYALLAMCVFADCAGEKGRAMRDAPPASLPREGGASADNPGSVIAPEPDSIKARTIALESAPGVVECSLLVIASAYNSLRGQTDSRPTEAAWGDSLYPGLRAIAVSRDLIPMGLGWGRSVRIDGMPGEYLVLDKMGARWKKHIDIYLGTDIVAAREWGRKEVMIRWQDTVRTDTLAPQALKNQPSRPIRS
jgi:3D (Asp-Asp-Asp) domain-containing protein